MVTLIQIMEHLQNKGIAHNYEGVERLAIDGYSVPSKIRSNSIMWVKDPDHLQDLDFTGYHDILVVTKPTKHYVALGANYLFADNSKEVFFEVIGNFFADKREGTYISKSSTIETAEIGDNVWIGHNCYIGPRVSIGNEVVISHNVVINGPVRIGNSTTISPGAIIGADGYGYYQNVDGQNRKVPHLGGIIIGDNVDIGANTCIDRGTLGDTIIGNNVKIDNLCHIAHNVVIEDNVSVVALSMIAGSVTLKRNSYVAPSASIMNQLSIGENSIVGLGAVVVKEVEDNVVVAGVPAKVIRRIVSA